MKKYLSAVLGLFFILQSCNNPTQEQKAENTNKEHDLSELSIYNLPSQWTNQDGKNLELKELRGDVLVVSMIYTSCKAACPRLVADMRHIQQQLTDKTKAKVKFVFVSIDPEVDTPERFKAFAIENEMNSDQWIFLRSTEENTREFAAVLAVNYKKISPIDFSHANIISVFNAEGELYFQQEGLGVNYDETVQKINTAVDVI